MPKRSEHPFIVAVVDDDPAVRRIVRRLCEDDGLQVLEASSFVEGRKLLLEYPWHAALVDLNLGDGDGADLCRELKDNDDYRGRSILILSGRASTDEKVRLLDLGADDFIAKPFSGDELVARLRAAVRVSVLQQRLIAANDRLQMQASLDGLTQLFNHSYFFDAMRKEFDAAIRYRRPLAVVVFDIDNFKHVNDTWGHATGDAVLCDVATVIAGAIRSSDIAARFGGDEFAVLLRESDAASGLAFSERVRKSVSEMSVAVGNAKITVSAGVAAIPQNSVTRAQKLVEAANKALYEAKRAGRNRAVLAKPAARKRARLSVHSGE